MSGKAKDRTPYEGQLYVLLFSDARIKVGKSDVAERRIKQHRHHAAAFGVSIEREWSSPIHVDFTANETALVNWATAAAKSVVGREYFLGLDFDSAVQFASSLPMLRQTAEQLVEDEARAEGVVDLVKAMWGFPTTHPITFNGVKQPMESDARPSNPPRRGTDEEDVDPDHVGRVGVTLKRVDQAKRALLAAADLLLEDLRYPDLEFPVDPVTYGTYSEFHSWQAAHLLVAASAGMEMARSNISEAAAHLVAEAAAIQSYSDILREGISSDENWNLTVRDSPGYKTAYEAISIAKTPDGRNVVAPIVKAIVD